jgi:hypothetical protein
VGVKEVLLRYFLATSSLFPRPNGLRKNEVQRLPEEQVGVNVEKEDHNDDGDDDVWAMMTATFGRQLSTGNKNGGAVGDDIRGVQLSGCFIHVVIVYENGEETWRTGDRTVGG